MDPEEARRLLGVDPGAPRSQVRSRYLALIRAHHPDLAGSSSEAVLLASQITQAYAVLSRATSRSPEREETSAHVSGVPYRDGMLAQVAEALDLIADLTGVDPGSRTLTACVRREGWPPCALAVILHERDGEVLAECLLDPLEDRPGPPLPELIAELHDALRQLQS